MTIKWCSSKTEISKKTLCEVTTLDFLKLKFKK